MQVPSIDEKQVNGWFDALKAVDTKENGEESEDDVIVDDAIMQFCEEIGVETTGTLPHSCCHS